MRYQVLKVWVVYFIVLEGWPLTTIIRCSGRDLGAKSNTDVGATVIPTGSYRDPYLKLGFQMQINHTFSSKLQMCLCIYSSLCPFAKAEQSFQPHPHLLCQMQQFWGQAGKHMLVWALLVVTCLHVLVSTYFHRNWGKEMQSQHFCHQGLSRS